MGYPGSTQYPLRTVLPHRSALLRFQANEGGGSLHLADTQVGPFATFPPFGPSIARIQGQRFSVVPCLYVYMATRFYQAMRENAFTIIIAALCVYDAVIIWLLLDG